MSIVTHYLYLPIVLIVNWTYCWAYCLLGILFVNQATWIHTICQAYQLLGRLIKRDGLSPGAAAEVEVSHIRYGRANYKYFDSKMRGGE